MYSFGHISLSSSYNYKCFIEKFEMISKNTIIQSIQCVCVYIYIYIQSINTTIYQIGAICKIQLHVSAL